MAARLSVVGLLWLSCSLGDGGGGGGAMVSLLKFCLEPSDLRAAPFVVVVILSLLPSAFASAEIRDSPLGDNSIG